MSQTKSKFETVDAEARNIIDNDSNDIIRDTIVAGYELTKRSEVPCLYISNPGFGKTTTLRLIAAKEGRHVEDLIASQYSQDELLGFQSNTGKDHLQILEPEWFHRIKAYSMPHYERISSGKEFVLVEQEQIDEWKSDIKTWTVKVSDLNKEIESYKELKPSAISNAQLEKAKKDFIILEKNSNPEITPEQLDNAVFLKFNDVVTSEMCDERVSKLESEIVISKKYISELNSNLNDLHLVNHRASILFLDEISTVSGGNQGAMLQLCFERRIRGDKKLPKDCIILAAANYKENLPGYVEMISPNINRFCLVNLLYGNMDNEDGSAAVDSIVDEFMQDFSEPNTYLPTFKENFKFTPEMNKAFVIDAREAFRKLLKGYSSKVDTSKGIIDFRNVSYDGIYGRQDGVSEMMNFISGRTLSYYLRAVRALCEMGITSNMDVYKRFVIGLVGLGTNTWDTEDEEAFKAQLRKFHSKLFNITSSLLDKFTEDYVSGETSSDNKINMSATSAFFNKDTISGKVKNILANDEIINEKISDTEEFDQLIQQISVSFDTSVEGIDNTVKAASADDKHKLQFRSDYEQIALLSVALSKINGKAELTYYNSALMDIIECYKFYYNSLVMGITSDQIGLK